MGVQYLISITPYQEELKPTNIVDIEESDDNTTVMQSSISESVIIPFVDDINIQATNANSMEVKDTKEYFRKMKLIELKKVKKDMK